MKEEKDLRSLNYEIKLVQMQKFINNFESSMKKSLLKDFKRVFYFCSISLLEIIIIVLFPSPVVFSICTVSFITLFNLDYIMENRNKVLYNKPGTNNKIVKINNEKDVDSVLNEGIDQKSSADYYKKHIEVLSNRSQIKDVNDRFKDNDVDKKLKFSVVNNRKIIFNKDEILIQLFKEMNMYCKIYKIPTIKISDFEWNSYFDILCDFFIEKGIESDFYDAMSSICRYVFAISLVNNKKYIVINDFVDNLSYLFGMYDRISKKELLYIQKNILLTMKKTQIVDFERKFVRKKR